MAGVHQRRDGRVAGERLNDAWDFRRPVVEGRLVACDCHGPRNAERDLPYLEAQFAGEQWEEGEAGTGFHDDGAGGVLASSLTAHEPCWAGVRGLDFTRAVQNRTQMLYKEKCKMQQRVQSKL